MAGTVTWGTSGDKSLQLTWGGFDEAISPVRYYNTASAVTAVNAATTYAQLVTAVSAFATAYGLTVTVATSGGTSGSVSWNPVAVFADVQQDFLWMLDEMSKYPPAFVLASVLDNIIFIGDGTVTGFGHFGGVTVGGTYYFTTVYNYAPDAVRGTFHHEFFHVIQNTWPTDFTAVASGWNAANPPGFTYGTHAAFTGEHPVAFIEDYGRNNRTEDQATFWAAMMGAKWASVKRWMQSDPGLAIKVGIIQTLIKSKNASMDESYYELINGFSTLQYTVKRNGVTVGATSNNVFVDDTANPNITYSYVVQATNYAGTASSDPVSAIIPGEIPSTPITTIALTDYQWEIGGLVIGKNTPFTVENFEGWGWDTRNNDAPRPLADGDYFGPDFLSSKTRTLTVHVVAESPSAAGALRQALSQAWYVDASDATARKPMRWKLPGEYTSWVNGRPRRASFAANEIKYGKITATLEYQQNDPLEYDDNISSMTLSLNDTYTQGMTTPITFPLTFTGSSGSSATINHPAINLGLVPVSPLIRIQGPIVNPRVDNQTTGEWIALNISLLAGQWVDVDFVEHTVMLNGTATRYSALHPQSSWWKLKPGSNDISYTAQSLYNPTSTMTLSWRNPRL